TADSNGHTLPYRVDVASGAVQQLAAEGSYTDLVPSPDCVTLYAVRDAVGSPPTVVALDAIAADQPAHPLPSPGEPLDLPSTVELLSATASDGTPIGSWLVRPSDASASNPAPLVVFIHGGPLASWTGWHRRWCPH